MPVPDGRGVGSCLGRVKAVYGVRGGLAARYTHRAFTALTVRCNVPVSVVTGVLKRAGAGVAQRCTGVSRTGVDQRVREVKGILAT